MAKGVFVGATGAAAGTTVGPENVVFLEIGGDDATGQRGNAARPFATWNAALAAMLDGDQLRIGPGIFNVAVAPTLVIPSFTIQGSGVGATFIFGAAAINLLICDSTCTSAMYEQMTMFAQGGGSCVVYDGTGGGGLTGGASFIDMAVAADAGDDAISMNFCQGMSFTRVLLRDGIIHANDCQVEFTDVDGGDSGGGGGIRVDWLDAADAPARQVTRFTRVKCRDTLELHGAPNIDVDRTCSFDTFDGSSLAVAGGAAPSIVYSGHIGDGGMNVQLPDTALSANILNLPDMIIDGAFSVQIAAPQANPQSVRAIGAQFLNETPGSIVVNDAVDVDALGFMLRSQAQVSTPGTGTFRPQGFVRSGVILAAGATVFPFGFNATTAPNFSTAFPRALAAAPIARTGASATDVTFTSTAGGTVDIQIMWGN